MALAWLTAMPAPASAHGGGLNAEGCHNDRKSGGYRCHRGPSVPKRTSVPDGYRPRNDLTDDVSPVQNAAIHSGISRKEHSLRPSLCTPSPSRVPPITERQIQCASARPARSLGVRLAS